MTYYIKLDMTHKNKQHKKVISQQLKNITTVQNSKHRTKDIKSESYLGYELFFYGIVLSLVSLRFLIG
jgi:hypothetical protein